MVVACVRAHQILPSVSSAAISEILGATCLSEKVWEASVGVQQRLRNFVELTHDCKKTQGELIH